MSIEKLKTVVHYVVASCDDPQRLGATRLNKILWFSDTLAYRHNGISITDGDYVKRQRGPVPKSILSAIRALENEGKIIVKERDLINYRIRLFISVSDPDRDAISADHQTILDAVMQTICNNHTANSISELSHDQIWGAANEGEDIPLWATLAAGEGEVNEPVMLWADSVVESAESTRQRAA